MKYNTIVLGSGPAGIEAARGLAAEGLHTALITVTPAGGRTTAGSLLPSKVWLHAAHHRAPGLPRMTPEETGATAERVRATIASRVQFTASVLRAAGVEVFNGTGTITGPGRVTVTTDSEVLSLEASALVIATGSEPTFAPEVRPDGERVIAPRHTKMLTEIPESLIMVGGGITGVEYGEAFARLGAKVTLISSREILPAFHRPYVQRLADHLRSLGVTIETGHRVVSVDRVTPGDGDASTAGGPGAVRVVTDEGREYFAQMAFIATGRAADLTLLEGVSRELREQIVDESGRFIAVDAAGRTTLPGVYACGDATGPPFTANRALWQGRQVARAILRDQAAPGTDGADTRAAAPETDGAATGAAAPLNHSPALIEAVFTDPQLAQIGHVPGGDTRTLREHHRNWSSSMLDSVHRGAHDTLPGELSVWTDEGGIIDGAAAFGEGAAEVLTSIQVAMNNGITWDDLTRVPFGYPTLAEVVSS